MRMKCGVWRNIQIAIDFFTKPSALAIFKTEMSKDSHFAATILDMRTSFSFELPFCRSPELGEEQLLFIDVFLDSWLVSQFTFFFIQVGFLSGRHAAWTCLSTFFFSRVENGYICPDFQDSKELCQMFRVIERARGA